MATLALTFAGEPSCEPFEVPEAMEPLSGYVNIVYFCICCGTPWVHLNFGWPQHPTLEWFVRYRARPGHRRHQPDEVAGSILPDDMTPERDNTILESFPRWLLEREFLLHASLFREIQNVSSSTYGPNFPATPAPIG